MEFLQSLYPSLTNRQIEILMAYARAGNQRIAAHDLGISEQTLKNHLSAVYRILGVETGLQAVYKIFGGELILEEKRRLMREKLVAYLEAEWLDNALRNAAQAAVRAMIDTIDHRLYVEQAEEASEAAKRAADQAKWPHGKRRIRQSGRG